MLEMGANIECNGYLTGYYSARDLVFGTEGSTWTSSYGKGELKNDCYNDGSLSVPSPNYLFGYNKEQLKQTILKHEAMFRDQIHELHRLYQKQREIMDELRRNELYKHNLRIEISWSSSLSRALSKNAPEVCCSPKLTSAAAAESSVLIAESIPLPLASVQEKNRQVCPAPGPGPTPVEEFLKDSKTSKSNYRKVGKKILDLELPADVYIDCEEGKSLEDERVFKVAGLSDYTLNGISQVEHNSDEKPNGANSNNFADLNEAFELEDEAAVKSDELVGNTHLRNIPFHELPRRAILGPPNLPYDVFNYPKKQDIQVCSDHLPPECKKKYEQLSYTNSAGQSGGDLNSFAKVIDKDNIFVLDEPFNKKLDQVNDLPGFHSPVQINQGPWSKEKNSRGERSAETQSPTRDGLLLGPSGSQLAAQDVGDPMNTNLKIMPAVCSEIMTFQSICVNDKENKPQDSRHGLPWLKEKPVPKRQLNEESKVSIQMEMEPLLLKHYLGGIHGFQIKKIEESDFCREKTLVFPINGKPHTSSYLHSSHASPSKVCQIRSDNQEIGENGRDCVLNVNIPCNLPDLGEQIPDGQHYMKNVIEKKHERLAGIIDLNSCVSEDEDMPIDINFQAPESSENKECSPRRGEPDEKQLEMPNPLARQEDQEVQEHQVRIAAEALVAVSVFVTQNGLQMTTSPSESFVSGPLHWFAEIASLIKDHPENEVKVDCSGQTDDPEEFLPAGIDYFEAMTLKLTETESQDCCCNKITGQIEKIGGSTLPSQPRKGRAKRGRCQKNFQSEVLPSLASLSRYEVTEDLQTIGGLIEAAGTHLETGSLRSAGRGAFGRGGRRSHASASYLTDTLLKHPTNNTDLGIGKRDLLVSWEKKCKKRRGQRYPTSNPQFFLSQVYS